ncbi:hypothetical protein J6590_034700 [Homalodisca vitripennis]|nr:hypothetical protein J6590_034700 [Homalodisca vitripennis]
MRRHCRRGPYLGLNGGGQGEEAVLNEGESNEHYTRDRIIRAQSAKDPRESTGRLSALSILLS